ncbi:FAD-dependent monooxygenase [Luteibacter sp. 9135]|uniref:FAD-dependent monooxygenase n=1 Tax=Luteibacter sp. 9135 TaxID=1500893 RepID=UPI0005626FD9|nr:FAD-dependent monooxygenase [Luteibacter sp. 9135]
MSVQTHVVIAGAGPAGLTLAIELARRGVSYRIVDRRAGAFEGSRGKGIQPRTLEIFADLGVVDRILAAGGPYPSQWIHDADGGREEQVIATAEATATEPYGAPWMVMQSRTEAILRERLDELGGAVEWHTEVTEVIQADAIRVGLRTPTGASALTCCYLVGADGGRSTVRGLLGIDFPGKTLGARAMVADLRMHGLDRRYWHRFNDGDMSRQLALCPLQGTDLIQLQAPVAAEGDVGTDMACVQALIDERTGGSDLRVEDIAWISVYRMSARLATHYRSGDVFLVGDAAHVHPPTGGQGLNTSIQDAYNLGWKLAAVCEGAADTLLDSYEDERRPVAEEMLGLSTRLLDAARQGDMRRGRDTRQLDIGYASSPLRYESPSRQYGPRAGDRAPDAWFTTRHGTRKRLFELTQGPRWTLMIFNSDEETTSWPAGVDVHHVGTDHELRDSDGVFQSAYAACDGDGFVIRPDGYIGAIAGAGHLETLYGYLRSLLLAGVHI